MKLIKETSTELVFREQNFLFSIVSSALTLGVFGLLAFTVLRNSASVVLLCDRVEPQQVNCNYKVTPLLQNEPTVNKTYNFVTKAEVAVARIPQTNDQPLKDYYLLLITKDGKFPILRVYDVYNNYATFYINDVMRNPEIINRIEKPLNRFLQSQNQTITFEKNNGIPHRQIITVSLIYGGICLLFILLYLRFAVRVITLKLDKNSNQISQYVFYHFLLSQESSSLNEIKEIVAEENQDSDGYPYFIPLIVMKFGTKYRFGSVVRKQKTAVEQVNKVKCFLDFDLHPSPSSTEDNDQEIIYQDKKDTFTNTNAVAPPVDNDQKIIYQGKKETFTTTNAVAPPVENPEQLKHNHEELIALGFEFLGDLTCQQFNITLYSYSQPKAYIYAVIHGTSPGTKLLFDFYSTFSSGASLTTTNTPTSYGNLPKTNIYTNSYPELNITELYKQHEHRLENLKIEAGELFPVGSLTDLAKSIDDYLIRMPSNFWFMVKMYISQFWYLVRGKYD